jgi:hypothetical protein
MVLSDLANSARELVPMGNLLKYLTVSVTDAFKYLEELKPGDAATAANSCRFAVMFGKS